MHTNGEHSQCLTLYYSYKTSNRATLEALASRRTNVGAPVHVPHSLQCFTDVDGPSKVTVTVAVSPASLVVTVTLAGTTWWHA